MSSCEVCLQNIVKIANDVQLTFSILGQDEKLPCPADSESDLQKVVFSSTFPKVDIWTGGTQQREIFFIAKYVRVDRGSQCRQL